MKYFPAIVCTVCDSPIDALVALCVPRKEAMELVTASWWGNETGCIVTTLHGGRPVAVLLTPEGRWAACNAFLDELFATPREASRRLAELLRRGRWGCVGHVRRAPDAPQAEHASALLLNQSGTNSARQVSAPLCPSGSQVADASAGQAADDHQCGAKHP